MPSKSLSATNTRRSNVIDTMNNTITSSSIISNSYNHTHYSFSNEEGFSENTSRTQYPVNSSNSSNNRNINIDGGGNANMFNTHVVKPRIARIAFA